MYSRGAVVPGEACARVLDLAGVFPEGKPLRGSHPRVPIPRCWCGALTPGEREVTSMGHESTFYIEKLFKSSLQLTTVQV